MKTSFAALALAGLTFTAVGCAKPETPAAPATPPATAPAEAPATAPAADATPAAPATPPAAN